MLLACVGVALAVGVVASSAALASALSFAAPKSYATGFWPSGLAVADVNGDGSADLATANYGEGANSVLVLVNGGSGRFREGREYVVGESPGSVAIGELNGDRKPDLAVANEEANSVSVLLNSGDGTFPPLRDYLTGEAPASVAIGDLNSNGRRDLATANFVVPDANITGVPGTVSVLLNSGDGGFLPKVNYRTGQRPLQVVIGDLTGDGQNRTWRPGTVRTRCPCSRTGETGRLLPLSTLGPEVVRGRSRSPISTATADSTSRRGTRTSTQTPSLCSSTEGAEPCARSRDYRAGNGPFAIAIGDVNGDGRPDLAAAVSSGNGVSMFVNKGNGSFLARRDYRTGREPWSVAIADLTGDGKRDLVTANAGANSVLGACE